MYFVEFVSGDFTLTFFERVQISDTYDEEFSAYVLLKILFTARLLLLLEA